MFSSHSEVHVRSACTKTNVYLILWDNHIIWSHCHLFVPCIAIAVDSWVVLTYGRKIKTMFGAFRVNDIICMDYPLLKYTLKRYVFRCWNIQRFSIYIYSSMCIKINTHCDTTYGLKWYSWQYWVIIQPLKSIWWISQLILY